jgi:Lon protease-like protein
MATELVPLFPLPLVLLPAMPLPLHIFEERYKEMMADVIAADSEFGVVLAREEGIINIGCTAIVRKVLRRYDDGRLDVLTQGQRRFRIDSIDQERSYLRADVEFFDDIDLSDVPSELRQRAAREYQKLIALEGSDRRAEVAVGTRLSFSIAYLLDDTEKRQTVLALRSETERLEFLLKAVPEYLVKQERTALAKRVAPLNGHAKMAGNGH